MRTQKQLAWLFDRHGVSAALARKKSVLLDPDAMQVPHSLVESTTGEVLKTKNMTYREAYKLNSVVLGSGFQWVRGGKNRDA